MSNFVCMYLAEDALFVDLVSNRRDVLVGNG